MAPERIRGGTSGRRPTCGRWPCCCTWRWRAAIRCAGRTPWRPWRRSSPTTCLPGPGRRADRRTVPAPRTGPGGAPGRGGAGPGAGGRRGGDGGGRRGGTGPGAGLRGAGVGDARFRGAGLRDVRVRRPRRSRSRSRGATSFHLAPPAAGPTGVPGRAPRRALPARPRDRPGGGGRSRAAARTAPRRGGRRGGGPGGGDTRRRRELGPGSARAGRPADRRRPLAAGPGRPAARGVDGAHDGPAEEPTAEEPAGKPDLLTPAGVRAAVAAVEEASGGAKVNRFVVYPEYAIAEAMVKGSTKRYDQYMYRGGDVAVRQGPAAPSSPARSRWTWTPSRGTPCRRS